MYTHPVLHALDALDRSSEQYQEQRVKIINKYTHTIDPVIDVESSEEEEEDEELDQFERGMTDMLSELTKANPKPKAQQRARVSEDLPTLLTMLAFCHGVLKGSPPPTMQLTEEERALVAAVTEGDAAEVSRLLQAGGRANLDLDHGDTLLHLACRHPVDRVIAAIARMRPEFNWPNDRGRSPLHELAANGGSLAVLCSLVKLGADPWARDHMGRTPTMLITNETLQAGFEKWLTAHNYLPPEAAAAQRIPLFNIPIYTKSGRRCMCELSEQSTAGSVLDDLPLELAPLRPVSKHMTIVEYRRKNGDLPPKLSLLPPEQTIVPLTKTWGEDPCGANTFHRFLLVPAKGAPREAVDAYEKAGFGSIGYKK